MIEVHNPCENCVCLAICRLKTYSKLYWDCRLLRDYVAIYLHASDDAGSDPSPFQLVYDILKPIQWKVTPTGNIHKMEPTTWGSVLHTIKKIK